MTSSAGELRGEGLTKAYRGGVMALDGVSFRVPAGATLVLLGPSGCGKSTLLRIVAGLEVATAGRLLLDGRPLEGVPPGARDVGFVFQDYALYPHLTVEGNLSLALRARRTPRAETVRRVRETAEMLGLEDLLDRRPAALSGGQQQRVALGRALVRRPRLYLLDEPLSNLDAALREGMRAELKALFRRVGATVLHVTHDQAEAMSLADEVLLLRAGRAVQTAPPLDLYARPRHRFAAAFVGGPSMNLWGGRRTAGRFESDGLTLPAPSGTDVPEALVAGIRPEDVEVADGGDGGPAAEDGVEARVEVAEPLGPRTLLTLRVGAARVRALAAPRAWPERVVVRLPRERLHWFDAATEERVGP